jgi:predicted phage terminase large subunit-like protein
LEGNLVKRNDVRYYGGIDPHTGLRDESLPDRFDRTIVSADCTFKDIKTADKVAIVSVGVKGRKRFVLNVINAHLDSTATEEEILRQREIHKPVSATLVEDKANGSAVIKRLKQTIPGVIAINPEGGKVSRVQAMAPEWQAGDWYVPRNAAWIEPFLTQLLMFPAARNDDMVDATSQAAIYLQERGWQNGWFAQLSSQLAELRREHPGTDPTELALKHGLIAGAVPYYNLEQAQMREQAKSGNEPVFARDRGTFGAVKSLSMPSSRVRELRSAQGHPDRCPKCQNPNLARYDGLSKCVCGWNSRDGAATVIEPPLPAPPKREGVFDFLHRGL